MPATKPWRDDLIAALASLGGAGHLNDIYQAVERIRTPLTKQWKGTVRCKLQQYSSDSRWWRHASTRNRADLFTNPRAGYWQLRAQGDNETVRRLEQQIAAHTQALRELKEQLHRVEQRQRALRVLFFTAPPSRPSRSRNR